VSAFKSLSVAMFKGFFRDRAALFFTFIFPLMFLVVFGLLFRDAGAEKIQIGAVGDGPVIAALTQTGAVELQRFDDVDSAVQKVRDGDLPAMVSEQGTEITLRFAASDQTRAGTVVGLVDGVVNRVNQAITGQPPRYTMDATNVEDSALEPIQFIAPGVLSWSVATGAVFGAALTLVAWRKKQVLRRIRLAPVRAGTILSSRISVTVVVAVVQAALFIGIGVLPAFGLKLTGQWWLAIPVFLLGITAFFAIGILVGSFAKTEEAATGAANIVVLPMAFLSGTFFPIDQAPNWLQTVSNAFPLRHMNDGIMDFLVRGRDAGALLLPCAVLIGFTLVVGLIAARVFQWEDH
jgi:ABC-2 type transport system permease protein